MPSYETSSTFSLSTGVTILLALSVYQIIVNEKLPATSDDLPVIGNILPEYSVQSVQSKHVYSAPNSAK